MLIGALASFAVFVSIESRVPEPLIPLRILTDRTTVLAIVASLGVGTSMFGTNVYLGQYFQYGLGFSPTVAGLLGLPMMGGIVVASTLAGNAITRRGTWKEFVLGGVILMTVGYALMWSIGATTPVWVTMVLLLLAGLGLGASNQNLILAVQNSVGLANMGAATSTISFFRTLFGAVGIQILGLVYGISVEREVAASLGEEYAQQIAGNSSSLNLAALEPAIQSAVRAAYADAIGPTFLVVAVMGLAGSIAVFFMRPTTLRDTVDVAPAPNR